MKPKNDFYDKKISFLKKKLKISEVLVVIIGLLYIFYIAFIDNQGNPLAFLGIIFLFLTPIILLCLITVVHFIYHIEVLILNIYMKHSNSK